MRRWKENLASKYKDVPQITQFIFFLLERYVADLENEACNVTLKVKLSEIYTNNAYMFHGRASSIFLLKKETNHLLAIDPGMKQSAAMDDSLGYSLSTEKEKHLVEMYWCYIKLDSWPAQLLFELPATEEPGYSELGGANEM